MKIMQLELTQPAMQKWGNSDRSVLEMSTKLTDGRLIVPLHQRQMNAWSVSKKRNWISRIRAGRPSVGVVITYQLYESDGKTFLNDGLQRLSVVAEYLSDPVSFGDDIAKAREFCDKYEITVQHRLYPSHDDALVDFQEINLGTRLTPYEFCQGVLTYMPNYEILWRGLFEDLHGTMDRQSSRILARARGGSNRETGQIARRNDLALFYRFTIADQTRRRYWSPKRQIDPVEVREKQVVEWLLRMHLETIGINQAKTSLKQFTDLIERETALIETLWHESNQLGTGISNGLYRFLLDVAIWRRNVGIPYKHYEEFARLLMQRSGGSGKVQDLENPRKNFTCGMDTLNALRTLCDILGNDDILGGSKGETNNLRVKPGYDRGHVQPKSLYGNGTTYPQPGGSNRSDGARLPKSQ